MPTTGAVIQPDLFLTNTLSGPRLAEADRLDLVRQLQTLLQEVLTAQATEEAWDGADNA
jgi:hypothetical protein